MLVELFCFSMNRSPSLYNWGYILLHPSSWPLFLVGDDKAAMYVDVWLSWTHIYQARYRSPGKDRQSEWNKWIYCLLYSEGDLYIGIINRTYGQAMNNF